MIILFIVIGVLIILASVLTIISSHNVKEMKIGADMVINELSSEYKLNEIDCSEFDGIRVKGIMKFDVKQYDIENVGNLCIMCANGGVMQMLTAVITPAKKDLPLLSVDYMYMLSNRIAYVEVYDLPLDRNEGYEAVLSRLGEVGKKFEYLNDTDPGESWMDDIRPVGSYKKVASGQDEDIMKMLGEYLTAYVAASAEMDVLPADAVPEKAVRMEKYSHGLIENGGISTDAFKKSLGEERTRKFFDSTMFGTKNYMN